MSNPPPAVDLVAERLIPSLLRMVTAINRAENLSRLADASRIVAEELSQALGASGGALRIDARHGGVELFCEGEAAVASLFCFENLATPVDCLCGTTVDEPDWVATDNRMGGKCRDTGYLSLFCAPVTVEGKRIGLFLAGSVMFKAAAEPSVKELIRVTLGILGDAVARVRAGEGVAQRAAELETVNTIGRLITAKLTLGEMAAEIVERIGQALDTDEVNVILYDDEREELTFLARLGEGDDEETSRVYPLSDGMNSWIVRNRLPLLIARDSEKECAALGIRHGGRPAKSWLGTPMFYQDRVIGVLSVQRYDVPGVYDERSAELLAIVAGQCAVAVENARLFEQALKREREKERIYFSLNHDLLSLVNPVRGFAKLMKSLPPEADRERFGTLADSVIASAEKITRFVEDVLIWGKIQSGKLTLNIARVDMVRIARAALHGVTPEMMMRKLTATINGRPYRFDESDPTEETPLMADIDAAQMERVFTNLLGNAVKHAKSRIDVTLAASDGFVTCAVVDDGEGVPSHSVDSLFEEYYQGGRGRRGVGLGLPTVKKIIELHHGAILVESDIGAGMTVEFSWPRTLADRTGRGEG